VAIGFLIVAGTYPGTSVSTSRLPALIFAFLGPAAGRDRVGGYRSPVVASQAQFLFGLEGRSSR